ncbi:MAG TPA: glycosyltransferase family 39 protein, partial [Nitrospirota bacterium]
MGKHHEALQFLLLGFYLFFGLGGYGLLDNNEGLYAEVAREMLDTKSFIIPQLNGVPYLEKPPLLYWLVALMFSIFGQTEFAARLVPVLAGAAVLLSLIWLGNRTGKKQTGQLAAFILGTTAGFVGLSRVLLFDMVLAAFLSWALALLFAHLTSGGLKYLLWSYFFLALAVLTKGLVAIVLYYPVAVSFLRFTGRPVLRGMTRVFHPAALALFIAVAAPWHILAAAENRDFAAFYFVNEHLLRFFNLREPHDYYTGPWYYYLPRLAAGMFPWTILLPLLALRSKDGGQEKNDLGRYLWIWFLAPLLFFSICRAKANY